MFMSNFWYGVVEDRMDPLMLGRLRVRIFGIHSPLKVASETVGSPTEGLLWCYPIQPITSAAISGVGDSPTGAVEGTHVVGFFRDEMCQDGVILGTVGGFPVKDANPNEGFNDPNGMFPRYINAPDTNVRARGGVTPQLPYHPAPSVATRPPAQVEEQDLNRDTVSEPDKTPADDIMPDPNPNMTIEEMLRRDEGVKVELYWDHLGFPTIGIGHLILHEKTRDRAKINRALSQQIGRTVTDGRITNEEVSKLFDKDLSGIISEMSRHSRVGPVYASLDDTRKMALINMCFQMGVGGVAKFTNTLAAMLAKQWQKAHDGMLDSAWAKQTPGRANRVAKIILNGNLSSYGVKPNSLFNLTSRDDGGVLFEEPASPYAAKYPYNHVYESESGHIQEFDDTPGAERYFRRHPSGTFEETHPSGTKVNKIVGDDFLIVQQDRNVHISGRMNIVVDGDAKLYVMGNMDGVVEGSVTQLVRGDVTEQVDGNINQTCNGNVDQVVLGNVNQTVSQNVVSNVTGDFTQTVNGNYTLNVNGTKADTISGDWTRQAANVNETASGTHKTVGNGASVELNNSMTLSGTVININ